MDARATDGKWRRRGGLHIYAYDDGGLPVEVATDGSSHVTLATVPGGPVAADDAAVYVVRWKSDVLWQIFRIDRSTQVTSEVGESTSWGEHPDRQIASAYPVGTAVADGKLYWASLWADCVNQPCWRYL